MPTQQGKWIAGKEQTLIRTVPYLELVDLIGGPTIRVRVGGRRRARTSMRSDRLKQFEQCNICMHCGRHGSTWGLNYDPKYGYVWNLYSDEGDLFELDHIIPKSEGGKDSSLNYQTLCSDCNKSKANKICFTSIQPGEYGVVKW